MKKKKISDRMKRGGGGEGGEWMGKKKKKSLQHLLFPGGHPSKYWAGPTLLNFSDRTRTGVFSVVWS